MAHLAIAGYIPNESIARKLASDVLFAARRMDSQEWARLVVVSFGRAGRTTVRTRWNGVRRLTGGAFRAGKYVWCMGPKQAVADTWACVHSAVATLPGRSREAWRRFRALSRGKQADEIAQMLLTWMVFFAAAGGEDFEGGLPDTDLLMGIGYHRSAFSHSVLLGLPTELALRFGLEALDCLIDRMPDNRHPVWARIAASMDRYGERAITGIWLGIGAHLLKDSHLLSASGTKPVVGLPWSMPMEAHQAFLASNGIASAAVGAAGRPDRP